jgi:hypothetical protein
MSSKSSAIQFCYTDVHGRKNIKETYPNGDIIEKYFDVNGRPVSRLVTKSGAHAVENYFDESGQAVIKIIDGGKIECMYKDDNETCIKYCSHNGNIVVNYYDSNGIQQTYTGMEIWTYPFQKRLHCPRPPEPESSHCTISNRGLTKVID